MPSFLNNLFQSSPSQTYSVPLYDPENPSPTLAYRQSIQSHKRSVSKQSQVQTTLPSAEALRVRNEDVFGIGAVSGSGSGAVRLERRISGASTVHGGMNGTGKRRRGRTSSLKSVASEKSTMSLPAHPSTYVNGSGGVGSLKVTERRRSVSTLPALSTRPTSMSLASAMSISSSTSTTTMFIPPPIPPVPTGYRSVSEVSLESRGPSKPPSPTLPSPTRSNFSFQSRMESPSRARKITPSVVSSVSSNSAVSSRISWTKKLTGAPSRRYSSALDITPGTRTEEEDLEVKVSEAVEGQPRRTKGKERVWSDEELLQTDMSTKKKKRSKKRGSKDTKNLMVDKPLPNPSTQSSSPDEVDATIESLESPDPPPTEMELKIIRALTRTGLLNQVLEVVKEEEGDSVGNNTSPPTSPPMSDDTLVVSESNVAMAENKKLNGTLDREVIDKETLLKKLSIIVESPAEVRETNYRGHGKDEDKSLDLLYRPIPKDAYVYLTSLQLILPHTLCGEITVRNIAFEKFVYLDYTYDNWASKSTIEATWDRSATEDYDIFKFEGSVKEGDVDLKVVFKTKKEEEIWEDKEGLGFWIGPVGKDGRVGKQKGKGKDFSTSTSTDPSSPKKENHQLSIPKLKLTRSESEKMLSEDILIPITPPLLPPSDNKRIDPDYNKPDELREAPEMKRAKTSSVPPPQPIFPPMRSNTQPDPMMNVEARKHGRTRSADYVSSKIISSNNVSHLSTQTTQTSENGDLLRQSMSVRNPTSPRHSIDTLTSSLLMRLGNGSGTPLHSGSTSLNTTIENSSGMGNSKANGNGTVRGPVIRRTQSVFSDASGSVALSALSTMTAPTPSALYRSPVNRSLGSFFTQDLEHEPTLIGTLSVSANVVIRQSVFQKLVNSTPKRISTKKVDPSRILGYGSLNRSPRKLSTDQVLVQVWAVGIDSLDVEITRQIVSKGEAFGWIPGRSFLGRVVELGYEVSHVKRGDVVMGLIEQRKCGACAELIVINKERLAIAPETRLSIEEMALLPLFGVPAWKIAISLSNNLPNGSKILILNAHQGIGFMTLQLLRTMRNGVLWITAQAPSNSGKSLDFLHSVGSDLSLYEPLEAMSRLHECSFDVVIDTIGGSEIYEASRRILRSDSSSFITTIGDSIEIPNLSIQWKTGIKSWKRNFFKKDSKKISYWCVRMEIEENQDIKESLEELKFLSIKGSIKPVVERVLNFQRGELAFQDDVAEKGAVIRLI